MKPSSEAISSRPAASPAFSAKELLACLAAVGLIVLLVMPALANTKLRSQRSVCVGNLGLIGRAFNQWAAEHDGLYPIHVQAPVGTFDHPSGENQHLWFQMLVLSNELTTPKVLACPGDFGASPAFEFSLAASGGYMHPNQRNNANSYFLGWPRPHEGRLLLSGDYYLPGGFSSDPRTGLNSTWAVNKSAPNLRWVTSYQHQDTGNLLFNDGSVEAADNSHLTAVFHSYPGSSGPDDLVQFLLPRFFPRTTMPVRP